MTVNRNSKRCEKGDVEGKKIVEKSIEGEETGTDFDAPDGGFGWVVTFGVTLIYISTMWPYANFTMVFGDFLEETGSSGSAMTLLNSMFMISYSVSGLLTNLLMKRYSIRIISVYSATIFGFSNLFVFLVQNLLHLSVLFLIQGVGLGMLLTACTTNINAYFVKRRAVVMNGYQVVVGLWSTVCPLITNWWLEVYGFRGCSAIIGALSLNTLIGALLMEPVEMHSKKKRLPKVTECQTSIVDLRGDVTRRTSSDEAIANERENNVQNLRFESEHDTPLLMEESKTAHHHHHHHALGRVASESQPDAEFGGLRLRSSDEPGHDSLSKRISMLSAPSLASIVGIGSVTEWTQKVHEEMDAEVDPVRGSKRTILSVLASFFEVSLLKDLRFVNMILGSSFVFLGDMTFGSFLPMILSSDGYTQSEVALTLTVTAVAELISRICLTLFTMLAPVKAKYLYLGASYVSMLCRIVFLYCDNLKATMVASAAIGVTRIWYMVPHTLVIADHFKMDQFAAAIGLFTVVNGLVGVTFGLLIGIIKDWTNSYYVAQWILIWMTTACTIPWIVEMVILDFLPWLRSRA